MSSLEERDLAINVVIATVPGGIQSSLPILSSSMKRQAVFGKGRGVLLELAYQPRETPLMKCASEHGWSVIEGVEMLIEQAFEQFELWTGYRAPAASIREAIAANLQ